MVVHILENLERATSKIVPLAKEFFNPLMVKARDNDGGYIEGEKGKNINSGIQEK